MKSRQDQLNWNIDKLVGLKINEAFSGIPHDKIYHKLSRDIGREIYLNLRNEVQVQLKKDIYEINS